MKNSWYVGLVVLTPIVLGFYHASSDGVTISYKMTQRNSCHSATGRIAQIQGLSFPDCVKKCALRNSCRALHYRRRFFVCDIFQSSENVDIGHGDCTFIHGSDIILHTTPCGDCPYGYVCDVKSTTCTIEECPIIPVLENGQTVGNLNNKASKIGFTCNHGYREKNDVAVAVCLDNGQWSETAECVKLTGDCESSLNISNGHTIRSVDTLSVICDDGYESNTTTIDCTDPEAWLNVSCTRVDCGSLPTVQNGQVVLDSTNGHFYQDTAGVICDDWYQSKTTSIKCLATGVWKTPTKCIDCNSLLTGHSYKNNLCNDEAKYRQCRDQFYCYPSSPWEYVGKTNVTQNGRICQRWDSQVPHPHPHTDLQFYPEQRLIDAHNYCRNPEPDYFDPWCMTMDPLVEWEFCNIKKCSWI